MGFIKIIAAAAVLFAVTAAAPMETAAQELYENQIFTAKIRNSSGQNLYSSDVIIDIDFLSAGGSSWQDDTAQVEYSVFYGRPEENHIYHQLEDMVLYSQDRSEPPSQDNAGMPSHMMLTIPCAADELSQMPEEGQMMTAVITARSFLGHTAKQQLTFEFDTAPAQIAVNFDGTADEKYFSDPVRATIQITEKNFEPSGVSVKLTDTRQQTVSWELPAAWHSQANIHTAEVVLENEGAYRLEISCIDGAGNHSEIYAADCVVDKTPPLGRIELYGKGDDGSRMIFQSTDQKEESKTDRWISNQEIYASVSGDDDVSGVKSVKYMISDRILDRTELEAASDWNESKDEPFVIISRSPVIIYAQVEDYSGNLTWMHSAPVMTDDMPVSITAQVMPEKSGQSQPIYSAADRPYIDIDVSKPHYEENFAGLKTISYEITCRESGDSKTGVLDSFAMELQQSQWTGTLDIDTEKFGGEVIVRIMAQDWAGNISCETVQPFQVDTDVPEVEFIFDVSDCIGGKYFNKEKTLTIKIDEKNFDGTYMPKVTASCENGFKFDGWRTEGQKHTGTVTFIKDGTYSVVFECADTAGNRSAPKTLEPFVIDTAPPEVQVKENGRTASGALYFDSARTLEICISEENFSADNVHMEVSAKHQGKPIPAPRCGQWISEGSRHHASVIFEQDGVYELEVWCTDLAGNQSEQRLKKHFIIDTIIPKIQISGVEDYSSNRGHVKPVITFSDDYLALNSIDVALTGVRQGTADIDMVISKKAGQRHMVITFDDFLEQMDDIYTLTASAADDAGNTAKQQIVFSVNRNGSAYEFDEVTKQLLADVYTNDPPDLVVREVNADTIVFREITCSTDGTIIRLKEGEDYTVKAEEIPGQWKQYMYTISRRCFEREGMYCVYIYSEDRADNTMTNAVKSKKIEFVVDRTPPSLIVSDLENGAVYEEETHWFTFVVKDRTVPVCASVVIDGHTEALYHREMIDEADGEFLIPLEAGKNKQKITLTAEDEAGNRCAKTYEVFIGREIKKDFVNKFIFTGLCIGFLCVSTGTVIFHKYRKH